MQGCGRLNECYNVCALKEMQGFFFTQTQEFTLLSGQKITLLDRFLQSKVQYVCEGANRKKSSSVTLLPLLLQLVLNFLRFVVLYQPKDVLVVHHTLNEFSLGQFVCERTKKEFVL